jgi:hypothetical protein
MSNDVIAQAPTTPTHGSDMAGTELRFGSQFTPTRFHSSTAFGLAAGLWMGGTLPNRPICWHLMEDNSGTLRFSTEESGAFIDFSHWNKMMTIQMTTNSGQTYGDAATFKTLLMIQDDTEPVMRFCGKFFANELNVNTNVSFCDYVFLPDYPLMPLLILEQYIKMYHHLPEIPRASEVEENGIDVSNMLVLQMKKIEELTLYTIQQQHLIEELQERLAILEGNE